MSNVLRVLTWILALALVALPVVAVFNGWIGSERWPLTKLRVSGDLHRVNPAQLRAALVPYAKAGFFAVKLDQAQDVVEQLPWVERAQVRKRWPDILEVSVVEHRPFARWGNDRLLSVEGSLFPVPKNVDASALPLLGGPDTQVKDVVALYNETKQLFAPMGLKVDALVMDARGSWSLKLDSGLDVIIGRTDARPRLQRFSHLLPRLLSDPRFLQRADLRYTNGFALTWADSPPAANDGVASPNPSRSVTPVRQAALNTYVLQQARHA